MIKVSLNKSEYNKIINKLKDLKENINSSLIDLLLDECHNWFVSRANEYLLNSEIAGDLVIADISTAWSKQVVSTKRKRTLYITNSSEKAVYVEFGVGNIAERTPHPNASTAGYKYNIKPGQKDKNDMWIFGTDPDLTELDLQDSFYRELGTNDDLGVTWIRTKGSPAVMYAYNALVDLMNYGITEIWDKVKAIYGY